MQKAYRSIVLVLAEGKVSIVGRSGVMKTGYLLLLSAILTVGQREQIPSRGRPLSILRLRTERLADSE